MHILLWFPIILHSAEWEAVLYNWFHCGEYHNNANHCIHYRFWYDFCRGNSTKFSSKLIFNSAFQNINISTQDRKYSSRDRLLSVHLDICTDDAVGCISLMAVTIEQNSVKIILAESKSYTLTIFWYFAKHKEPLGVCWEGVKGIWKDQGLSGMQSEWVDKGRRIVSSAKTIGNSEAIMN